MGLAFAYNTNGFAHHRLEDAIRILADLGYKGIQITPDVHQLNPMKIKVPELNRIGRLLSKLKMRTVIETGARFILDPKRKHYPTLLSDLGRRERLKFLKRSIRIAGELGSEAVSFWSGAKPKGLLRGAAWHRLILNCRNVASYARRKKVRIAFEPEPGMFIETLKDYTKLRDEVGIDGFDLALDVGHLKCTGEMSPAKAIRKYGDELANVALEDIRGKKHEHLMFGEGSINFPPIFNALTEVGYRGLVGAELSRDSHRAVEVATKTIKFFRRGGRP